MLREAETRRAEALREAQALIEGAKAEAERVAAAAGAEAEASARRREQMAMDRIAAAEKFRLAADSALLQFLSDGKARKPN